MIAERTILEVLAEQRDELASISTDKWCNRMEESQFELNSPLAQVVIGVRRSGKSTICHKVLKQAHIRYAYVNLDDDRLFAMTTADLNVMLSCVYQLYGQDISYLLLDEIQNVEGWHLFVNRLLRIGFHVYVTGSNAKLLSSELATHLTGRFNEIRLYPFSFSEYCAYMHINTSDITTKAVAERKAALNAYLMGGGFPELGYVHNKRAYVQGLMETIVTKDIRLRYNLRNVDALRLIANHLVNNSCQEINYDELTRLFGLGSAVTTKRYVGYLVQAFLVLQMHKFSFKSRIRLRESKGYVVDTGMIANRTDALLLENQGWRLENVVYIELLRRCAPLFYDVYYYKPSSRDKEVDFVVCNGNSPVALYQVAFSLSHPKTYYREVSALIKGAKSLHCETLTIVTLDEERTVVEGDYTIHIVSAVNWLLGKDAVLHS